MNKTKRERLYRIISGLLFIIFFFISSTFAQEVKCLDTVEGKVCQTEWVETYKSNSKLLQTRFAYLKKLDVYYVILGRMSLKSSWQGINKATLTINKRSHTIKSIDQDTREAGDGVFEVRTFYFSKSFLERIMKANNSKFEIGNEQFIISKEVIAFMEKLFDRVSILKSTN